MTDSISLQLEQKKRYKFRTIEFSNYNLHANNEKFEIHQSSNFEISVNLTSIDEICIVSVFDAWRIIVKSVKSRGNEILKIPITAKGKYYIHIQYNNNLTVDNIEFL
jgi:hypothetical protein